MRTPTIDREVWGLALGWGLLLALAIVARGVLASPEAAAWLPAALCRPTGRATTTWSLGAAAGLWLAFGFGHCLGMCGPFVLAYASGLAGSPARRLGAHLRYSLGRSTSYAVIGAIAGALGASVARGGLWLGVQGALSVLAGVTLLGLGAATLLGRSFEPRGLWAGWGEALKRPFARAVGRQATYRIGLLNGLLPCSMVASGAAMALAAGSMRLGALTMAVYGLGTLPAMLLLGVSAQRLHARLQAPLRRAGAVVLLASGLWILVRSA